MSKIVNFNTFIVVAAGCWYENIIKMKIFGFANNTMCCVKLKQKCAKTIYMAKHKRKNENKCPLRREKIWFSNLHTHNRKYINVLLQFKCFSLLPVCVFVAYHISSKHHKNKTKKTQNWSLTYIQIKRQHLQAEKLNRGHWPFRPYHKTRECIQAKSIGGIISKLDSIHV